MIFNYLLTLSFNHIRLLKFFKIHRLLFDSRKSVRLIKCVFALPDSGGYLMTMKTVINLTGRNSIYYVFRGEHRQPGMEWKSPKLGDIGKW